jgi:hypothetical protein
MSERRPYLIRVQLAAQDYFLLKAKAREVNKSLSRLAKEYVRNALNPTKPLLCQK